MFPFSFRKTLLILLVAVMGGLVTTQSAQAGPLLDWLRGRRCFQCFQSPQQPCAQPCATTCQTTCMQTCSRVVVNYVPCTAYRTCWDRVPVTQYRPVTTSDPCTGCTTTCMKPCTTYTWRMKQVPYTTYRPVYRRETYQVPVTYTTQMPTNACGTCAPTAGVAMAAPAAGCSTCATGVGTFAAPNGTISTGDSYYTTPSTGTPTPADSRPSLNSNEVPGGSSSYQMPQQVHGSVTPITDPSPASRMQGGAAPQLLNPFEKTTQSPSIQRWNYSPVQLASYQTPVEPQRQRNVQGTFTRPATNHQNANVNAGWHTGR